MSMSKEALLERTKHLSPERRALIMRLMADKVAQEAAPKRASREGPLVLSYTQNSLWTIQQMYPESTQYNICFALRFAGALDEPRLREAVAALATRHESLRTRFEVDGEGQPHQVIEPQVQVPWSNCAPKPGEAEHSFIERLLHGAHNEPFDLQRGPLFRVYAARLNEAERLLVFTFHHIISDGWSHQVFMRDLVALYRREPLPELAYQYADFAAHQQQRFAELEASQMPFWRQHLAGYAGTPLLAPERKRGGARHGASHEMLLPASVMKRVHQLAAAKATTPFIVMMAGFKLLLQRYSGSDDLCVGVPVANRDAAFEQLVGCFVNTLPLRTQLGPHQRFEDLVATTHKIWAEAFERRELPFEKIVETLNPERRYGTTPIFQILFSFQNLPFAEVDLDGARVNLLDIGETDPKFDLMLDILEREDGARLRFCYNAALLDGDSVADMAGHYQHLLERCLANPERAISALPSLTDAELATVHAQWNNQQVIAPGEALHKRFEANARRYPEHTALVWGNERLSYAELNRRANRLAHHLLELGVTPDTLVGLSYDRGSEMIVALLAILKAGAAYLPLSPEHPRDRLTYVAEQSGAKVILTGTDGPHLPRLDGVQVVITTAIEAELAAQPETEPELPVSPDQLAYALYTSGSTGKPKGVMVTHGNVTRLMEGGNRALDFRHEDVWTQFHAYTFDLSVWEIWGAFMYGGTLVIVPAWMCRSPKDYFQLLRREAVTRVSNTPSAFYMLADVDAELNGEPPMKEGVVVLAGEALDVQRLRTWFRRNGHDQPRIVNSYGITETTVYTTLHHVVAEDLGTDLPGGNIGVAMPGKTMYVLDHQGQIAPPGVTGEIFVGGDGIARGYLGRPDLTAYRYVPDPFSTEKGARLYRSGDLGRYLSNGEIEFAGRSDHQVKVRGYRVELGEVEAAIATDPAVAEVAVVVQSDPAGGAYLVAFIQPRETELDLESLKAHLAEALPDYMQPHRYQIMTQLPRSASDKIDRKRLSGETVEEAPTMAEVAGSLPLRARIAEIWSQVLGHEEIMLTDHFFEKGGHSLGAVSVMTRLNGAGEGLPVRLLFDHPVFADFVNAVAARLGETQRQALPALQNHDYGEQPPLSFAQRRMLFLERINEASAYNMSTALHLKGTLDVAALQRAVDQVIARHEVLRTNYRVTGTETHTQLREATEGFLFEKQNPPSSPENLRQALIREATRPFDLADGPLLRLTLFSDGGTEHWLLFSVHHIACDGLSLNILVGEVAQAYTSVAPNWEALPYQYGDYAHWQAQQLQGERLARGLDFWRDQLHGATPLLEVPGSKQRPPLESFRGGRLEIRVPAPLTTQLKAMCEAQKATPFMVFLTVYKLLLARFSGRDDIVVGVPRANRALPELEGMIGLFINTLTPRTRLDLKAGFSEALAAVRDNCLAAFEHGDVPIELIVEEVVRERSLSHHPIFQHLFNFIAEPVAEVSLGEAHAEIVEFDDGAAKFDLELTVWPEQESYAAALHYNGDLYSIEDAQSLADAWLVLLEAATQQPELPLDELAPQLTAPTSQGSRLAQVRGYTLCLDRLEQVALTHPSATRVRTLLDEDWGLILFREGTELGEDSELMAWLRGQLPDYYLPRHCLVATNLDDGLALEAQAREAATTTAGIDGEVGQRLARIWQDLLETDEALDAGAGFFELGGNSLMLLDLVKRIEAEFQLNLPFTKLFIHNTLSDQAAFIAAELGAPPTPEADEVLAFEL